MNRGSRNPVGGASTTSSIIVFAGRTKRGIPGITRAIELIRGKGCERERERVFVCLCAQDRLSPAVPFNGRNGCCSCFSARTSPRSMLMRNVDEWAFLLCLRDKKKRKHN